MSRHRPKSHYQGMTPGRADEIRRKYFSRESNQRQLAQEYGRSQSSISRIISGQVWSSMEKGYAS